MNAKHQSRVRVMVGLGPDRLWNKEVLLRLKECISMLGIGLSVDKNMNNGYYRARDFNREQGKNVGEMLYGLCYLLQV